MENTSPPKYANGKICYVEIPAISLPVSVRFYQQVFGWIIHKDNSGNIAFDDTVGEVSGMWILGRKPATEIGFVISIRVTSIEATSRLIEANGGKMVMSNTDGPEKIAHFTDPAGNIFGLYQQSQG
jgi:predicted enzyme related to lactoylglutathione lyase